jgi:acyl-CoA dehydrogenase
MEEEARVIFEIGRAAPAFRSMFATNVGIGSQGIAIDGTPEQKARYLPRLASGELIGSFALTEPEVGSDAGSVRTTARRDGDDYVLNGTKRYITNAPHAGVFTVMARTNPDQKGAAGVSAFVVEAGLPGLSLGKPERKMGQQGAHVCDVVFDNCRVPADALIGGVEGQGFKTAMKVLDKGRLHIAAACTGLAERIIDDMLAYAIGRRQFGKPIAEFQLLQGLFADSKAEALAARALVLDAARRRDGGEDVSVAASCAKMFASEMVGRVADRNVQVHGGAGYIRDYRAEQLFRDARLFRIYEGTTQIQQTIIARAMIAEARAAAGIAG